MAKKRSGEVTEKRKAVKVRPIERKHAGKVVEPYKIMEALIDEVHERLKDAKILLCWRKGWKPDVDKVLTLAKIKKASDLDRAIGTMFEAEYDFVMQLNEEAWSRLRDEDKKLLVDHELCHAMPDLDRNGEQKRDEKGWLCWRNRKHPIEQFFEIIERHGIKRAIGLNEAVLDALAAADMPLFNQPSTPPVAEKGDWRTLDTDALGSHKGVTVRHLKALRDSKLSTVGELADLMDRESTWWHKKTPGIGPNSKTPLEDAVAALRA